MGYYLGIDGGGSKTTALLADAHGNILGLGMAGPTSGHFIGHEALINHLRAVAAFALDSARFDGALDLVFIGAPAVYQDTAEEALNDLVPLRRLHCEGDARTAFTAALGGQHGVVILAGTGSFARGVNRSGESVSIGGWGTLLGDEGSAYDISVQALRAVARASEGRAPETALTQVIKERFRINRIRELTRLVYRPDFTREQIASLAPLVTRAAQEGDQAARQILAEAGEQLGELACTAIERLGMAGEAIPVVLTGGVQAAGELIKPAIARKVRRLCPEATFPVPRYEPAIGAVILALETAGIAVTEQIKSNLDRGLVGRSPGDGGPKFLRRLVPGLRGKEGWS